ncbi:hypothetical protein LEMLEM_LOCUS4307 [Lemmus lemmus]
MNQEPPRIISPLGLPTPVCVCWCSTQKKTVRTRSHFLLQTSQTLKLRSSGLCRVYQAPEDPVG